MAAISIVVGLQAFNSFTCYGHDFRQFLSATAFFVGLPLIPAAVSLVLPNPLRAVAACALLAPWLLGAYYTDCVRPDAGGGASMIYVSVLLWGAVSATVGAVAAGWLCKLVGIVVIDD